MSNIKTKQFVAPANENKLDIEINGWLEKTEVEEVIDIKIFSTEKYATALVIYRPA
jgi:hypothetical protein